MPATTKYISLNYFAEHRQSSYLCQLILGYLKKSCSSYSTHIQAWYKILCEQVLASSPMIVSKLLSDVQQATGSLSATSGSSFLGFVHIARHTAHTQPTQGWSGQNVCELKSPFAWEILPYVRVVLICSTIQCPHHDSPSRE